MEKPKRRPGIYLLPNLFTTAALFAGFYAIIAAMNDRFVAAAVAVFVAGILDGLDGRVARLTKTQSDFGVQYDSLSDLISFGLAPALVMYSWSLHHLRAESVMLGKIGWLAAFLYAACAALRLARFNTQAASADKAYFQGLASPAAAGSLMSLMWAAESEAISGADLVWVALPVTIGIALLMVSNVRYYSFKSVPATEVVPFVWILLVVLLFVLLAIDPPKMLFLLAYAYVLSGLVMTVIAKRRSRAARLERHGDQDAE